METIEKRNNYVYGTSELVSKMKKYMEDVESFIKKNDYHVSEKSENAWKQLKAIDWKIYFGNASKNQKKKINKSIDRFYKKQSISSVNRFFHYIHTIVLATREKVDYRWGSYYKWVKPDWIDKFKLEISLKEQSIQAKRKQWLEAKQIALRALKAYKDERGDFYKS